ncbi:putative sushi, von Willebrand factor type A [Apostichopus japonicus]|uniref:Putative sushi, von Willebrand factor type A n=1 Tax=Stichopus japonicus TaxID=307972 RepID=A0A2G8KYM8_STIJA|nr:putative sushi, von Willebrand factor type A [Apostichopus japonicus]
MKHVFNLTGPCNLPTNYEFVDTMVTEPVNDGVTVSLRCIDGYEPTDVTIVECQNGTFGDVPTCVLATPCTPPTPDDNNVVISPNYNSYDNGTTVTYSCPGGYDIAGNLNSQCINGSWSPPDYPTCETSICLPQTVSDDLVIISPDLSGYSNGSSITYSCPDRYILEGSNTSVCINTVWTQEEDPTCTKILECLNPVPLDPVIILDPDLELYLNGSDVQFSCPIGYQLNGNESASCVNGDWVYVDEPSCSVLSCDDVSPGDDMVERDPSGSGPFPNGTKVVYSCPDGYDLSGDTTALCLYGNWTLDTDPSCTALPCDEEAPAGEMVVRNPSGSAPYLNGTEVVYSCPDGYALEGDMTAVCLYGNWTLDTEPSCGVLECANPAPMDPMVNLKPDLESYTNGTEVQYSCPNGFELNGDSSAFCVYGNWVFTEEPSCSALSCDDVAPGDDVVERDPSGSGPFPNGTKVVYSCPDGYDLSGDTTALCLYGNWTLDTDPSCTALSCDEEAPAGEMVVRNPSGSAPYLNGTEVVYSCPDGYSLEGDMTAVCRYGNWTLDTEPSCEALSCDEEAPAGEMVVRTPSGSAPYPNGSKVFYSCPDGYALEGDMTAVCQYGNWTLDTEPSCGASPCDEPLLEDPLVSHSPDLAEGEMYPNGTDIYYACPSGWDFNGNMTAVCLYGGWTHEDGFCTASQCADQAPAGEMVLREPSTSGPFENGTQVAYSCPDGYDLAGDTTAVCQYGNWTLDAVPSCAASQCNEDAPAGDMVERDPVGSSPYPNGTEVVYSCLDGYTLVGDSSAVCQLGNWTLEVEPSCEASPCDEPAPPDDLVFHSPDLPEGETYTNGTEIMYDCPEGWDFSGNMTAVCLYGVWTYEDAFCTASPCDEPAPLDDLVSHSPDLAEGEMYENGTEIMYDCPEGWDFNGNMTAVCHMEYGLMKMPFAQASPCDEPMLEDPLVSHSPDLAEGEMYENGTEITYDCPEGWDFNGNMTAVCLYGVWTYENAFCTASPCDEPMLEDPLVSHSPDLAEGEMYENGTEITYDCPEGWDFNGNMTAGVYMEYGLMKMPFAQTVSIAMKSSFQIPFVPLIASPCDEPMLEDPLVSHSPDLAEGEMYENGTEITYDCPEGWDFNGNMTAVCLYGVWTYENAFCTASPCDEPMLEDPLVSHSPDLAEGEMYENGTEITYDCPEGWDFNGNMTAVCLYGVWTYENAFCTASPCDEPMLEDPLVSHSPDLAEGEMYENGTEITYDCPEGWDFNGNMTAVCLYGVWTYENAFCTASPCDEPMLEDPLVSHSPDLAEGEMYENGTEITYDCPEGWDFNGNMTAVCLYGVWTYENAFCTASPCDEPMLEDPLVSHSPDLAEGEMYENGTEITYDCPEGWDFNGNMTAVVYMEYGLMKMPFAQLHHVMNQCLKIHCPDLAEGEMYENGTEITYDCPEGWDFNGNMTAVCLYGVWTYENAFCTASPCDEPMLEDPLVSHSPDLAEGEMYENGTEITYDCPEGWDFNGNMTAVCLYGEYGLMKMPFAQLHHVMNQCLKIIASPCDEPMLEDPLVSHSPDLAEGEMYENGTEITYDCPEGWDFNGNMTAVCLYGVWTYENAFCTASPCDEPMLEDPLVSHSPDLAEGEMYENGTEITYDCPEGWDFNGNMTAVCLYGVWTYENAFCTASPCDEPMLEDPLVSHSPDLAEGEMYENGTEITYDCPEGWDFNGNMTAVCLYGVWTYENAFCTASPCDEPMLEDPLVSHSPDLAEGEMYENGTEITYDCPEGWDFNGNMTAVCLYGVWTYENAFCTASPCDEPMLEDPLVSHSPDLAEGEMYENGTEITYDCPEGWDFNGNMTAVCLYGVWTYENAFCTASPCDEPAPLDDLVSHSPDFAEGEMYENGTEIMYDCPEGWDFNGNMTAVCLYGVWTYENAFCTASPCDEPMLEDPLVSHSPDLAEGEMYENGTEITYDCPEGWDFNGNMTAVCLMEYGLMKMPFAQVCEIIVIFEE